MHHDFGGSLQKITHKIFSIKFDLIPPKKWVAFHDSWNLGEKGVS